MSFFNINWGWPLTQVMHHDIYMYWGWGFFHSHSVKTHLKSKCISQIVERLPAGYKPEKTTKAKEVFDLMYFLKVVFKSIFVFIVSIDLHVFLNAAHSQVLSSWNKAAIFIYCAVQAFQFTLPADHSHRSFTVEWSVISVLFHVNIKQLSELDSDYCKCVIALW